MPVLEIKASPFLHQALVPVEGTRNLVAGLCLLTAPDDFHEARVRRGQVILVDAVVHLQLPVGIVGVGYAAGQAFHALRALFHGAVDEEFQIAEVALQGRHVRTEASEEQALVAGEAREGNEVVVLGVERGRVAGGLSVLDVDVATA